MTTSWRSNLYAVLVIAAAAGLGTFVVVESGLLRHEVPQRPMDRLRHWLICFDCTMADLDAVLAEASLRADRTRGFFASALLDGPSAGELQETVGAIRRGYRLDVAYLRANDTTIRLPPEDDYVREDSLRFDRSWRVRAAVALGQIGTQAALGVLGRAESVLVDTTVLNAVKLAPDTGRVRASLRQQADPGGGRAATPRHAGAAFTGMAGAGPRELRRGSRP